MKPFNNNIWNKIETASFDKLQKESAKSCLSRQLTYIFERSHFYRKKYESFLNIRSPYEANFLDSLPFTEKKELLDDQAEHPPFGSNLCVEAEAVRRVHKTSGTTGSPLIIAYADGDIEYTHEAGARCFWASGLRPYHCVVHCLNFNMWAGGLTDYLSLEATGATVIPFGVGNSKNLIETILFIKPQAIHCTPSYLSKLELILRDDFGMVPAQLGLKLGLLGAEGGLEDPNYRKNIERKWGIKAMNANYGMAEVLSMFGAECSEQDGLHFMGQDIVLVDIIGVKSLENLPIETGVVGELVLTNLKKKAQPLLRYRTHDIIQVIDTTQCACGRDSFRFKIIGRSDDMIVVKGVNVFPMAIGSVINSHLDHLTGEYQILIDRENPVKRLCIKVELKSKGGDVHELHSRILEELTNKLAVKPQLDFVGSDTLPRAEGKTERIKRVL